MSPPNPVPRSVSSRHLDRIEKEDPLGWIALGALSRIAEGKKGSVVVCTGVGHGYFGKVATDGSGGVIKSMAAIKNIVDQDGPSIYAGKERDAVLQALIETPQPIAVVIRDVDIDMKLIDSIFAIAKKKTVRAVMIFWKKRYGYFHEAHRIILVMAAMHGMKIVFESVNHNGEILFAICRKEDARESVFPVGLCQVNEGRTSDCAG